MSTETENTVNLVVDIGGTNTRVALANGDRLITASIRRYINREYSGLEPILTQYFSEEGETICNGACVDLAGPVRDNVGRMTNLDWVVDHDLLRRATGASHVAILNDLQAQGHSVGHVAADNLRPIIKGTEDAPQPNATSLVINVGTGFNAAAVFETPGGRFVAASECGHINLPVRTQSDLDLCQFIEKSHGFAAVEDVLSGRGLERLYLYLGTRDGAPVEKSAADIMASVAMSDDPRADQAVELFIETLGNVAGSLALTHLPFGGIYLVGGVARAMTPHLERFGFSSAFCDKGRFSNLIQSFSVSSIEDDYAALTGCASHLCDITP